MYRNERDTLLKDKVTSAVVIGKPIIGRGAPLQLLTQDDATGGNGQYQTNDSRDPIDELRQLDQLDELVIHSAEKFHSSLEYQNGVLTSSESADVSNFKYLQLAQMFAENRT